MRFLTAVTVLAASTVLFAACDGPQGATGPNETPSFAKISPQIQYTATLTCNAAASRSFATVVFEGVLGTFLFCNPTAGNQVTVTSFSTVSWGIQLQGNDGFVKPCPRKGQVLGSTTHTGQFSCKDTKTGLSAVLTIEPS